ncbi:hypothetical protein BLOT_000570, partial [Blomia tropicalis]
EGLFHQDKTCCSRPLVACKLSIPLLSTVWIWRSDKIERIQTCIDGRLQPIDIVEITVDMTYHRSIILTEKALRANQTFAAGIG